MALNQAMLFIIYIAFTYFAVRLGKPRPAAVARPSAPGAKLRGLHRRHFMVDQDLPTTWTLQSTLENGT